LAISCVPWHTQRVSEGADGIEQRQIEAPCLECGQLNSATMEITDTNATAVAPGYLHEVPGSPGVFELRVKCSKCYADVTLRWVHPELLALLKPRG
jgi:hypothetical protein